MPYSLAACQDAAKFLGKRLGDDKFEFATSSHKSKGCFGYFDGEWANNIYYGTGGTKEQAKMELVPPKYRPPGFDCDVDSIGNLQFKCIKNLIPSTLKYLIISYCI